MPVTAELLKAINREVQGIPIEEERWKELAVEVNQLRQAAAKAHWVYMISIVIQRNSRVYFAHDGAEQQRNSQDAENDRRTSQPVSLRNRRPH
jgi:hypothetical protein